jgi:membrane protein
MILLLWFYLSGLAILLGAELNATVEHASSRGKNFGEKVPGQRRRIGVVAMKKWIARRRRKGKAPPSVAEVKAVVEQDRGRS